MERALIVSGSEKATIYLTETLKQGFGHMITAISNVNEARRIMLETRFDLCIINTPLQDEFGEMFACNIAASGVCEVILLVKCELFDEISHKVEEFGVITVAKPIHKTLFWNALKLAQITHKRVAAMQQENKKLTQEIEDIKMVDRAKCILVSCLSITEPEAHRYIEKCAMDKRVTRKAVAQEIVEAYYSSAFCAEDYEQYR